MESTPQSEGPSPEELPPVETYANDIQPGTTDEDLALRFSERHADDLRYVAAWDRWLIWDGCKWAHDETMRTWDMARALLRDASAGAAQSNASATTLSRLGAASTVYSVLRLARADRRHAVAVSELDSDPWLLNTPGGVVDLRTGALLPHDRDQLHTKVTAATPGGECPLFLASLERFQPASEVRDYIQRLAGYALTGSSRDHVLPFWWGGGRNGKGTILRALQAAMGDYAREIAAETLMEATGERHPTEMCEFFGARLVIGSEVDAGKRWNESRVKRLTGGDRIAARYCGKDFFNFEPSHTLIVMGNNKPGLRQVDEAIRRRLHLVQFGVTIPEAECDATVPERLRAELGGILQWALQGATKWQQSGLGPPDSVRIATAAYLAGEDQIESWIDECCERRGQVALKAAFMSYRTWAEKSGTPVLGKNQFRDQLEARGFGRGTDSRNKSPVFSGLSLPVERDWRDDE